MPLFLVSWKTHCWPHNKAWHTLSWDLWLQVCTLYQVKIISCEKRRGVRLPVFIITILNHLCHTGTLWNVKGGIPTAHQAQTLNAVVASLSECLDLDSGTLILELRQAEETRHKNTTAPAGLEESFLEEMEEMDEEEEAPKHKNGSAVRADNDFSDLLPVRSFLQ